MAKSARILCVLAVLASLGRAESWAQTPATATDTKVLPLDAFRPKSMLAVEEHLLTRAEVSGGRRSCPSADSLATFAAVARRIRQTDGRPEHRGVRQPRRRVGRGSCRASKVSVDEISRSLRDLRQHRLAGHRQGGRSGQLGLPAARLRSAHGRGPGRRERAGGQRTEGVQDPGARVPQSRWFAHPRRRSTLGSDLGGLRRAGFAGADSHGRSQGVLSADRRNQRAVGGAQAASRLEFSRTGLSELRRTARSSSSTSSSDIRKPRSSVPTSPPAPRTWGRLASGSIRIRT